MNRKSIIAVAVAAIIGLGVGAGMGKTEVETVTKTVEVPGPQPTPQIVEKIVEKEVPGPTITVTPAVCVSAVMDLDEALQAENDILMTIAQDGVDAVTQDQIDRFMALDPESIYAQADACLAASDIGS